MKEKALKIYKKYDSYISYIFFGVLTTLINVIVYYLFSKLTGFGTVINTVIAWVAAVLFAFFTNRKWVFKSENTKSAEIFNEAVKFFLCRILTGILDVVIMYVFVDILKCNDLLIKIISNIIVIIVNFVASKYIIFVKNKNGNLKETYINTGIYILLFMLACLFLMNSPLNPIKYGEAGTDSAVFKHIGYLMTKGYIPYKDIFDHKGPLVYLYNYIGTLISYYRGIWVIEVLSMFVTLVALYKSARLYLGKFYSIIVILICTSVLGVAFEEGNLVEEYALPFISIALYIFLEYFKKKDITKFKLILNGFCFGGVCMLRPNMVSLWIAFCILVLVQKIKEKRLIDILYFVLYFLIGAALMILPFCIWLIKVDAWNYFIEYYIKFNMLYSNYPTLSNRIIALVHFTFEPILMIAILYSIYMIYKYKEDRLFNVFNLIYIIVTILLVALSGRIYNHYGMIIVPCVLYAYAMLISNLFKHKNNEIAKMAVIGYFIIVLIIPVWSKCFVKIGYAMDKTTSNNITPMTKEVADYIKKHSSKNDKISVYANYSIIYVLTKREPASIYTYLTPIKTVDSRVLPRYYKDLDKNKPKFIICREYSQTSDILDYLKKNNYKLVLQSNGKQERKTFLYELSDKKEPNKKIEKGKN